MYPKDYVTVRRYNSTLGAIKYSFLDDKSHSSIQYGKNITYRHHFIYAAYVHSEIYRNRDFLTSSFVRVLFPLFSYFVG